MKSIGIFGGGQLAKMIMLEGYKMGYTFNVYDPNDQAVAKPLSNIFYNFDFTDEKQIDSFFEINDVFTYEFENIDPVFLEKHTTKIPQGVEALKLLQDRYFEKNFVNSLDGVKTVGFKLGNTSEEITFPCIIKTRRNGYDGKGQFLITKKEELKEELLNENYVIEDFIKDIVEYSIVIGRNANGETFSYEPIKNIHRKGILYESTFAKDINIDLKNKMLDKAKEIIKSLNYVGVLCVEYFVKGEEVYVNEIAPRVHNSGHITIEASNVSQFKLHLLCILGLNVPELKCYDNYYMVNVLGHDLETVEEMLLDKEFKNVNYHIYGKNSYVKNRKVGHITFEDIDDLQTKVTEKIVGGID